MREDRERLADILEAIARTEKYAPGSQIAMVPPFCGGLALVSASELDDGAICRENLVGGQ